MLRNLNGAVSNLLISESDLIQVIAQRWRQVYVFIVDDSALIRALLSEIINDEPGLELVGAAPNAYVARDMVNEFAPDVITLDIEMPKVNGLTFLDGLMKARPTPR